MYCYDQSKRNLTFKNQKCNNSFNTEVFLNKFFQSSKIFKEQSNKIKINLDQSLEDLRMHKYDCEKISTHLLVYKNEQKK